MLTRRTAMNNISPTKELFSSALREKYSFFKHPSGLEIYIFPKKMSSAYAFLGTRFGSVDNTFKTGPDEDFITVPDGVAHFLEHKLFTNEDGSDSFERFSELGADANAYTTFGKTVYYFGCTENFEENLRELITFVTHPYFTEESIKKEIGIIAEEIRMYDDSPQNRCYYGMLEGLYHKHSIKRNICGSEESIKKITPALLYDCHKVFYSPSNMVLAVCGDIAPERILSIADEILPGECTPLNIVRSNENLSEPREANKQRVSTKMNVSKPIFHIGIKDTNIPSTPEEILKKNVRMMILNDILFSESSYFYNDLLDRELIYPGMRCGYTICDSFAYNSISGKADDPERVYAEIRTYIDRLIKDGLCENDLKRAKRVAYAEFVKLFDSTEEIADQLFTCACDGTEIFMNCEIINSVTLDELQKLLQETFSEELFTLSTVYPLKND